MKKLIILVLVLAIVSGMVFARGGQQDGAAYPNKPVQVIVPFGPGGGTDVLTRTFMKYINLGGQNMVAVNIEGASGFVGTMDAANRPGDGYTILVAAAHDVLSYTFTGQTTRALYDELIPVCVIASDYDMVSTNSQSGFRNIQDVVAFARANPGQIRWGTTGTKTANAVNSMWMAENLGILNQVTFVPYDGGAQAKPALLGDHVQVLTGASGDIRQEVAAGTVVPLMVINDNRVRVMPNTPTTKESGCEATIFVARTIWAPRGTPTEVIRYLENAFRNVSQNAQFKTDIETLGIDVRFIDTTTTQNLVREWKNQLEPRFARLN
jgi:tripartite-type tricarboxylate transporter receptor subunit TctC